MSSSNVKLVIQPLRVLLFLGSGFVLVAGIQLLFLADQTDIFFAWTIMPPLTAAVLGAFYFGTMVFGFLSAREKVWAYARGAVPAVIFFTSLTLAATLLHLDRFHFNSANPLTLAATYVWLIIYAVEPPVLIVLLWLQSRAPGGDPPRTVLVPVWFRGLLCVQGTVLIVVAAGLFVTPQLMIPLWPWILTPLTARAIAAWFVSLGVVCTQAVLEKDWKRLRVAMISFAISGMLELIILGIYARDMRWNVLGTWIVVALLVSILGVGTYGWLSRKAEE